MHTVSQTTRTCSHAVTHTLTHTYSHTHSHLYTSSVTPGDFWASLANEGN